MASSAHPAQYFTLDDPVVLTAATTDPAGFIQNIEGNAVIDEVQRAPQLFVAIKAAVDRNRQPGRFLLTGSANVLQIPRLSESLAGRMEILTLWPLSQGEVEGVKESFIDLVLGDNPLHLRNVSVDRDDIVRRILCILYYGDTAA